MFNKKAIEEIIENPPFFVMRIRQLYGKFEASLYKYRYWVLLLSLLIVFIPFMIARLPFFLYYPVPFFQPDSGGYWAIVWTMENGKLPIFSYRTPGYPLFMYLTYKLIASKLMAVIIVQNIIALVSLFLTVYSVFRVRILFVLTPLVALAMGIFTFGGLQLSSDLSPLTESLYTSCMIIAFALLITGFYEKRSLAFCVSSVFMVLSIMVRPTGQFLIVTYIMIMIFLLINRRFYRWKSVLAFAIPFPFLILLWMSYNYFTFGKFKMTDGLEITLICATSMYYVESPDFSGQLNAAIRKNLSRINSEDKKLIYGPSWDLKRIGSVYYKGEYWDTGFILRTMYDESIPELKELGSIKYYRKVALHTIKNNWKMFLKVYAMNIYLYFFESMPHMFYAYEQSPHFYDVFCVKKYFQNVLPQDQAKSLMKEYYSAPEFPCYKVVKTNEVPDGYVVEITEPFFAKLYHALLYHMKILRTNTWVLASIGICLLSGIMVLLSKFRNVNFFLLLALTSALIGHCLVCSIFAYVSRFSVPTFFIYYLSVALFPIIFFRNPLREANVSK